MIITIQKKDRIIDVIKEFRHYKYAIREHEPILLSTGMWLHTYKVTKYETLKEDPDEEQEAFNNELYN